ncbi:MAG: patatin-like phospholipase family protein [Gemmatimonadota bacterium]
MRGEGTEAKARRAGPQTYGLGLMLGGGGARAAYQAGVMAHIGRRLPDLSVPILTGVSAGAINIGFLASHCGSLRDAVESLCRKWCSLTTEEVFRADPWSLMWIAARWGTGLLSGGMRLAPRARSLVNTEPLRHFLARSIDTTGIVANLRSGRLRSVAISALSYQTGRTVTFVQSRAPVVPWERVQHRSARARLTVDHITASAAIPILFPAVKVGQQWYGDGSFRFTAPLSPAIHLGADRVLAISSRYGQSSAEARRPDMLGYPPPAQILGLIFNSVFLDTLDDDAARLERINGLLARLPEADRATVPLRRVDLLVLRPSKDVGRLALEYEASLPRTLRFFVKGLGTAESRSNDFLSYLLFESTYVSRLIRLGEEDAEERWEEIAEFLLAGREAGAAAS